MYVWSWGSAEHKLLVKDWCKSGAGDEREGEKGGSGKRGGGVEGRQKTIHEKKKPAREKYMERARGYVARQGKQMARDRKEASSGARWMLQQEIDMQVIWSEVKKNK